MTIFAIPFDRYDKNDDNAHVTISSWRRIYDNAILACGKISGDYVSSVLIKTDAAWSGFDENLVLTQDGHIPEGSTMKIWIIRDDVLITPLVTENILEGITRRTVVEMACNELGLMVID